MKMLDLFCGRGGWTKGFMAEGWECVGYDLNPQPHYPASFAQWDVLTMTARDLQGADFICASSPCEQFSIHGLKCFHPHPAFPELGMKLFCHTKLICEQSGKPFVMENVRSAQKFVGTAVNHCGPFYLWGNAVPALLPPELFKVSKGTKFGLDADGSRKSRKLHDTYYRTGNKSKARREYQAEVAEIPESISRYVAQCATRLVGESSWLRR